MVEARTESLFRPRVLIVDDEALARRFLRRLLLRDGGVGEIRESANGLAARDEIARARPDIMFLDVEMPGLSGADLLESLPPESMPVTVFTTAYSAHAIKAFELQACDYLLKPFDEARFGKALQRAKARAEAARRGARLAVQAPGGRTVLVDPAQIVLVAAEDNYVSIRVQARAFLHRATLVAVERALRDPNFLRVHRGFLVNLAHVREIVPLDGRRLQLSLSDGSTAPVSRRYRDRVRTYLAAR
ncbi:MAG: LytR/AlgR family response regulator transcription factor [Caulobacterales bacterium]